MFKKFNFVILGLILGLTTGSFASIPIGDTARLTEGVVMVFDEFGHEVPFPRNAVIIFPWEMIEGYWTAAIREIPGMFHFRVDASDPAHRRLRIAYYDQTGTKLIAEGMGIIDEEEKSVRANLEGPNVSVAFVVTAYKLKETGIDRTEIVTNIILKGPSGKLDGDNYVIRRLRR